jgi:predicted Zn-ribbon and HTH transcriptional regulator
VKRPKVPSEDLETVRKRIISLLEEGPRTAREISAAVRIPEREVEEHLFHLRKTLRAGGRRLAQTPAECLGCGFVFRKRDRPKGPGRCPVCRGEFISDPAFRVEIRA